MMAIIKPATTNTINVLILLIGLVSVFCGATLAFSNQKQIATVMALRGHAIADSSNGEERRLEKDSAIYETDLIHTGANARIQIRFLDQTIVNLGQNASLNISQFDWDQKKQKGSLQMDIQEGAFRVLGGLITKKSPQNFMMNSPVATIGIRGSSFAGEYAQNHLDVVFLSGVGIFVTNPSGTVDLSTPGLGTEATRVGAPSVPTTWSSGKLESLSLEYLDPEATAQNNTSAFIQNQPSALLSPMLTNSKSSGSAIEGKILNQSENKNSLNIAIGEDNKANLGSISVSASEAKTSIVNQSQNSKSANIAIGKGNVSNLGSTKLHETNAEGSILNHSVNTDSKNISFGEENQSNLGSTVIE